MKSRTPIIVPIVWPNIDWHNFVVITNDLLGRSPTRSLDAANVPVGDLFSFLGAVEEFQHANSNPRDTVQDGLCLRHASISVVCEYEKSVGLDLIRIGNLEVIWPQERDDVFLVSGTLEQFQKSIVRCSHKQYSFALRMFVDCLIILFEQKGLGRIFNKWKRQSHNDGTFSLT
jgi:hypothetical protein